MLTMKTVKCPQVGSQLINFYKNLQQQFLTAISSIDKYNDLPNDASETPSQKVEILLPPFKKIQELQKDAPTTSTNLIFTK